MRSFMIFLLVWITMCGMIDINRRLGEIRDVLKTSQRQ